MPSRFNTLDALLESMSPEQLLREVTDALSDAEADQLFSYIADNWGIEIPGEE